MKNQPAPLLKTNLDLRVPAWILISCNELYPISQSELNDLVTYRQAAVFQKFRRISWFLVYRDGICYSKMLRCSVCVHCTVSDRLTQQDDVAQIRFSTIKYELFLLEVKIKSPKSVHCKLIFFPIFAI